LLFSVRIADPLVFAVPFDQRHVAQLVKAAAGDSTVNEIFHYTGHIRVCTCH
jgi:hypothetical protein